MFLKPKVITRLGIKNLHSDYKTFFLCESFWNEHPSQEAYNVLEWVELLVTAQIYNSQY